MTRPPASPDHAHAWAFVLQHLRIIERYAERQYHPSFAFRGVTREDFRQALIVDVVGAFAGYDPARAGASTWLWWRALRVRAKHLAYGARVANEISASCAPSEADRPRPHEARYLHAPAPQAPADVRILVAELYEHATPTEAEALDAHMLAWTPAEVWAELGVSPVVAQRRLAELRARALAPTPVRARRGEPCPTDRS